MERLKSIVGNVSSAMFTDALKRRIFAYLLKRYLGDYLETKITPDQLDINLAKGEGVIQDVRFDIEALNEISAKYNLPVRFISGRIARLACHAPLSKLLTNSTHFEIDGLEIVVQPLYRCDNPMSMFESMWGSVMSTSLDLARECMDQDDAELFGDQTPYNSRGSPLEGVQLCARAIDSFLCRIKLKFTNTTIQIEHTPKGSPNGVGFMIHIDTMHYSDEAGNDKADEDEEEVSQNNPEEASLSEEDKAYVVYTCEKKNFTMEGIRFHTVEFDLPSENDASVELEPQQTIPCGFVNNCELQVQLKTSESVAGAKVTIEVEASCAHFLLTPRQVYVLLEVYKGFMLLDEQSEKPLEQPMTPDDYARIQQEMDRNILLNKVPGLQGAYGWSSGLPEEENETFYPMMQNRADKVMNMSTTSNLSSHSMDSSINSTTLGSSASEMTSKTQRKINSIETDPTAEISNFNIRFSGLSIALLHEDVLTLSSNSPIPLICSVHQLTNIAEKYFTKMGDLVLSNYKTNNFDVLRPRFAEALDKSHLRLICTPVHIELHETTTSSAFFMTGKVASSKAEFLEVLYSNDAPTQYVRLLNFNDDSSQGVFTLNFQHIERTSSRSSAKPKTSINVILDDCNLEVDVTMIDRLLSLIYPQPVIVSKAKSTGAISERESLLDVRLLCQCVFVKLRFPVPDFRPPHDMQRVPWWKRNVRAGFLGFTLNRFSMRTCNESESWVFEAGRISLDYLEREDAKPQHIGIVEEEGCRVPSFTLHLNPKLLVVPEYQPPDEKIMYNSADASLLNSLRDKGPFSSKNVYHNCHISTSKYTRRKPNESNVLYCESEDVNDETSKTTGIDPLVEPGDSDEIANFIKTTSESSQTYIEINLPAVSLQLTSKHLFEVLYNHISSDLLLWEPHVPSNRFNRQTTPFQTHSESYYDLDSQYSLCRRPSNELDSDEGDDDDLEPAACSIYQSLFENISPPPPLTDDPSDENESDRSYLSMCIKIGRGSLLMLPLVRDSSDNVIPEQLGALTLRIDEGCVFTVSGYKGDENLGYVSIQAKDAALYHNGMLPTELQTHPLLKVKEPVPTHLAATIARSERGVLYHTFDFGSDGGLKPRDLITVAIEIKATHETHHVKTVKVAVGLDKATLRHRISATSNTWYNQLIDFFDVADYPIMGYTPKEVLTEFHLRLWDCAIDYRPLYFPFRTLLTVRKFYMSSHIVAASSVSTLRFIIEDCYFFMSEKYPAKNGKPSTAAVDLKKDYVLVMDFDIFEILLQRNERANPKLDLRAYNNAFNIRTCADSARTLMMFITYLANNGDINSAELSSLESSLRSCDSPMRRGGSQQSLINVEDTAEERTGLTDAQQERVEMLIDDAMRDDDDDFMVDLRREPEESDDDADVFLFPGEKGAKEINFQVTKELGDLSHIRKPVKKSKEKSTSRKSKAPLPISKEKIVDGFCFLGDDLKLNYNMERNSPKMGVEGHHVSTSRHLGRNPDRQTSDLLLDRPNYYPTPESIYSLLDMSIIWQIYAGNDFDKKESNQKSSSEKQVTFDEYGCDAVLFTKSGNSGQTSVYFSNAVTAKPVKPFKKTKQPSLREKKKLLSKGGVNRNMSKYVEVHLMKIKIQHEEYPENDNVITRQAFLMSNINVFDRLVSSEINTFAYLLDTPKYRKPSRSQMLNIQKVLTKTDTSTEGHLRISVLPLKLNIDQDTLLLLIDFYHNFSTEDESLAVPAKSTPTHSSTPIANVDSDSEPDLEEAQKMIDENLLLLLDNVKLSLNDRSSSTLSINSTQSQSSSRKRRNTVEEDSMPTFYKTVVFANDVIFRIDYSGKYVDISHGPVKGLLMGLSHLNKAEFRLKRCINEHGLLGVNRVVEYLIKTWSDDFKATQIPSILGSIGPFGTIVTLVNGVYNLFAIPIEQYRRDGRIFRGIKMGCASFSTATCLAALELTSRLIYIIQLTAETAYDIMSPGPSLRKKKRKSLKRRHQQSQDIREGVTNAIAIVRDGFGDAASNIVQIAATEKEQKGYTGAFGGVLRQIPAAAFTPVVITAQAMTNVLEGMQNQLMPDARHEANQKWKCTHGDDEP